jgi:hypothetical protein
MFTNVGHTPDRFHCLLEFPIWWFMVLIWQDGFQKHPTHVRSPIMGGNRRPAIGHTYHQIVNLDT